MELLKPELTKNSKETPLVSIITPTYNHEKFIRTCIESVLRQTYTNWEMIIIDDGSTDRTGSIIGKYKDKRIRYVKQENLGIWNLHKTYNKALKMANGDLIAILEGDDVWPSYKLEEQVQIFKKHDIVLSWGKKLTINDKNEIISFDLESFKPFIDMPQEELTRTIIIANFIQACTVMINKNALLSIGGFLQHKDTPYVDYLTFLELSLKGRFYPSDRVLGYWRKHKAQVTTKQETDMNKAFMFSLEFYERLDPSLKKLIKINKNEKLIKYENVLNGQKAVSARLSLIKGDWNEALTQYKSIFVNGNFKIKVQSFLGIICALFKRDLEWFAVLSCKPKVRDASGEWDSTLFNEEGSLSRLFKFKIFIINCIFRLCRKPLFDTNSLKKIDQS